MLRLPVALLVFAAAASAFALEGELSLDRALDTPSVWADGDEVFMHDFAPLGFAFASGRDTARSTDAALSFLGHPVAEAFADFRDGKVVRMRFTVYNRGDAAEELDEAAFAALARDLDDKLRAWAGRAGRPLSEDSGRQHKRSRQWGRRPVHVLLEWAYTAPPRGRDASTPFRAEYVRVTLIPFKGSSAASFTSAKQQITGYGLKKNVVRHPNGDVLLYGVPMVDQGQKGYCAAATAERLLRYYGRQMDQHDVARLADTARASGTSSDGMLQAFHEIARQYQLDVKKLRDPDWKDYQRLISDYNRQAKMERLPPLPDYGNVLDINQLYADMDALALKGARLRRKTDFQKFQQDIRTYIGNGVPLLWSCIVGKFPENPPLALQGSGGHLRMIVGYNPKTSEILYSDSWGPGHELKRIPADQAWAILTGLYVVKPRDIR
ncbi:MAG: C39 family peptidase [Kiritimatiellia bacterium]|jgi:hypothetical protein